MQEVFILEEIRNERERQTEIELNRSFVANGMSKRVHVHLAKNRKERSRHSKDFNGGEEGGGRYLVKKHRETYIYLVKVQCI